MILLWLSLTLWVQGASSLAGEGCVACHAVHRSDAGTCVSCHRGDDHAQRIEIAHQRLISGRAAEYRIAGSRAVFEGRRLVGQLACRRCHTIEKRGNQLATSLDGIIRERDQEKLSTSISSPVENMPRFGLNRLQIEAIIAYALAVADESSTNSAYRVHFSAVRRGASRFDERCGGCHRALLAIGPAGRSSSGPNLSGLFTADYPPAAGSGARWTPESMRSWIDNPRTVRPQTSMRPLRIDQAEYRVLVAELGGR